MVWLVGVLLRMLVGGPIGGLVGSGVGWWFGWLADWLVVWLVGLYLVVRQNRTPHAIGLCSVLFFSPFFKFFPFCHELRTGTWSDA